MSAEHPRTILFDIDKTIFDSHKYRIYRDEGLSSMLGISVMELAACGKAYQDQLLHRRLYDPHGHAQWIATYFGVNEDIVFNAVYGQPDCFQKAVYDDVFPTLHQLHRQEVGIGIFSEGNMFHQRQKLEKTGIAHLVDPAIVYIFDDKTTPEHLQSVPRDCTVVDDKLSIIALLVHDGREAIWLNRTGSEMSTISPTIFSLQQLTS